MVAQAQVQCVAKLDVDALVERFDIEPLSDFQPNEQTLEGSFSSVSTPKFASKYSLELGICSKRRLRKGTSGETEK